MNNISPNFYQRLEALVVFVAGLWLYFHTGGSWVWLVPLFFSFDISALGYLANPRVGALSYNAVHSYALPAALGLYSLLAGHQFLLQLSCLWIGHIGFDRAQGIGLKYTDNFWHTHLGTLKPPKFIKR